MTCVIFRVYGSQNMRGAFTCGSEELSILAIRSMAGKVGNSNGSMHQLDR